MNRSDTLAKLAAALVKAQSEFPDIPKTAEVRTNKYSFRYTPLDVLIATTRPALTANGLVVVQLLTDTGLETMLLHSSGECLSSCIDLSAYRVTSMQELGSRVTYARRYAYQSIIGVASDEDTDGPPQDKAKTQRKFTAKDSGPSGQATSQTAKKKNGKPPTPASLIMPAARECGFEASDVLEVAAKEYGVSDLNELSQKQAGELIDRMFATAETE